MLLSENESVTNEQELNKTVDDFSLFDDNFMTLYLTEILKQQNFC